MSLLSLSSSGVTKRSVNSETASASLCWIDQDPKTEGISSSVSQVRANAILIQSNAGYIYVDGVDDGDLIEIYAVNGEKRGSSVSKNRSTCIDTNLQPGNIAIVKIKDKSIKVIVK